MAERAPSAPITTSALTSIVLPSGLSHKLQIKRARLNQINYILDLTIACSSEPNGDTRTTRESPPQATGKHAKLMSLILLVKGKREKQDKRENNGLPSNKEKLRLLLILLARMQRKPNFSKSTERKNGQDNYAIWTHSITGDTCWCVL